MIYMLSHTAQSRCEAFLAGHEQHGISFLQSEHDGDRSMISGLPCRFSKAFMAIALCQSPHELHLESGQVQAGQYSRRTAALYA